MGISRVELIGSASSSGVPPSLLCSAILYYSGPWSDAIARQRPVEIERTARDIVAAMACAAAAQALKHFDGDFGAALRRVEGAVTNVRGVDDANRICRSREYGQRNGCQPA
jgi:hypothetical protein